MSLCHGCKCVLTEENCSLNVRQKNKHKDGTFGPPRGRCKDCFSLYMKEKRRDNPKSFILYISRSNSKIRGIENTLTLADIPKVPKYCPVFPWIELAFQVGTGRQDNSPSLDRIDNNIGYVPGNVRIISWRANCLKKDATDKELAALGVDATKRKT